MSLAPGSRFGPYELVAALGAGGMGEVYRARDVKLNRDVAIKVLPEAFRGDVDRLARFKREAQVLASLSHPHIGHIYGIEDTNGVPALVLELVDGPTLSDRLERSAPAGLPVEEALAIASQIADALDAAHERGIVHRDLKPANIKITPDGVVKVLDFGLAKMADPETGTEPPLSRSPTLTVRGTRDGMLLGTAAYMSPEQARGLVVDKRADVWAFGCVLYEMLTGQSPFARGTVTDTLVAILEHKPDWTKLPAGTSAAVRRLVERCLAKDPRQRLRDLGDARLDIADAVAPSSNAMTERQEALRSPVPWGLIGAIVGTAIVAAAATWSLRPRPATAPESSVTRLVIGAPSGDRIMLDAGAIALSPNGRRLAYVAGRGSRQQIYIREFDQFESKAVPGTEGGYNPFLSPDGQWLGFFAGGKLKKVRPGVGEPVTIGDALIGSGTPTWEADDTILFTPVIGAGIMRIPAAGGKATPVTTLAADENAHQWPQLLPGGKTLLFSAVGVGGAQIYLQSLETGQRRKLVQGLGARYLPSGHLVFFQGGTVMAVPFDTGSMDMNGTPVPVLSGVLHASRLRNTGASSLLPQISIASAGGTLAFVPADTGRRMSELVWVDSSGAERPTGASGGDYSQPRVSPDGRRVAVVVGGDHNDVWLFDLARQTWNRFTSDGNNSFPVWSPDGNRLVFVSDRAGVENMYARNIGGNTDDRLLVSPRGNYSLSMARDGTLAFVLVKVGQAQDIWIQHPDQRDRPVPWLETPFSEGGAAFAPDGRWLAYVSNESGRNEIYVRPHPGPGEQVTISTGGGNEPLWARDGRQLFYRNGDAMFAVDVQGTPTLAAGKPRRLFEKDYERSSSLWQNYDVSPDSQRFLMIRTIDDKGPAQIDVVLNWLDELKRQVPSTGLRKPE